MSAGSESWPPALKAWVADCLGQMSDFNREEAQQELRKVISDAYNARTLWTTDWAGVQLNSLLPKPLPTFNHLKRKLEDTHIGPPMNKKTKKSQIAKAANATASFDPNDRAALNRRAERFKREHQIEAQKNVAHNKHHRPFHIYDHSPSPFGDDPEADPNVPNWDKHTIVGTSTEIFKDYLRLTSDPRPELIRPFSVLQKTLAELTRRWKEKKTTYNWMCSQLKSMRQDLTVQRIKNSFTVSVYEIHARMALESSDLVEFNACQATLKNLYELEIGEKKHRDEFIAYRILALLHGHNRSELNLYVGQLTSEMKQSAPVQHALAVQRSLAMGNYHAFFDQYINAPNMGAYIMDHFVERERIRAVLVMTRAYQSISIHIVMTELAFETYKEVCEFLDRHQAGIFDNPGSPDPDKTLKCKAASVALAQAFEEKYRRVQIKGAV